MVSKVQADLAESAREPRPIQQAANPISAGHKDQAASAGADQDSPSTAIPCREKACRTRRMAKRRTQTIPTQIATVRKNPNPDFALVELG